MRSFVRFFMRADWGEDFTHPEFGHEETMIDWIAIQFPKILEVFKEADCL